MDSYDLIIIDGGAAAFAAAAFAAATKVFDLGRTALIINTGLPLGGTCVNVGCAPTKHLLTVGDEVYYAPRSRFRALGNGHQPSFSFRAAIQEKEGLIAGLRQKNYAGVLEALDGVTLLEAQARFVGPTRVQAPGQVYGTDKVLIAAGASARPLSVERMDRVAWQTNRSIMDLEEAPESLIIIGGGREGLEFAQMFTHFGAQVTVIVTKGHRVLRREEREIVNEIVSCLEKAEIRFLTDVTVDKVEERNGKKVLVNGGDDGGTRELIAEELLLAAGIQANTAELDLEKAGARTGRDGFIQVDERYQTENPAVYAAGDCIGKLPLETVAGGRPGHGECPDGRQPHHGL